MRRIMEAMRRNLLNTKKNASGRVADEDVAIGAAAISTPSRWNNGTSFLCGFSLFSCLSSDHRPNGPDGVWVSAELPQTSELTHLMVRDSLRYAILM